MSNTLTQEELEKLTRDISALIQECCREHWPCGLAAVITFATDNDLFLTTNLGNVPPDMQDVYSRMLLVALERQEDLPDVVSSHSVLRN